MKNMVIVISLLLASNSIFASTELSCDTSYSGTQLEQIEKISKTMIALDNQTRDLQLKYWDMSDDEMRAAAITISENQGKAAKCAAIRNLLINQ